MERMGQKEASSSSGSGSGSSASLSRDSGPSVGNASLSDRIKSSNDRFKQHLVDEDSVKYKSELDGYLLESSKDPDVEDFNILMWWKTNSSRYQVLSQIASDVLAILISTVASESAFSMGGRVLDSFRSSLSPNTVKTLICTQNWLKDAKNKRPIKLRESMDNVEDMDGFEIGTGVYIYMFILFVIYVNCLFICSMLKNHFVLNEIVEIASICPMPMEEDPSSVVLDDDK